MSSDLFNHLINIKERFRNEYGVVYYRSKYLARARYVLYRQRIFKPAPKLIIDRKDLPIWIATSKNKDLLIGDVVRDIFMSINEKIYNDVKTLIKTEIK